MRNLFLDGRSAHDIDHKIDRVHKDLGDPEGKIDLDQVRELLRLDLRFYAADDLGLFEEVVHKLKLGTKQVINRPSRLIEAIQKFDLKALFVPDRKQILIDAAVPDLKKRWVEGHEISHSLIPWHLEYMLGDDRFMLSPGCHDQIEAEANYGTGRLLFPQKPFLALAKSSPSTMAHIRSIAEHFGNTITSSLWRYIENSEGAVFGAIGQHPHHPRDDEPNIAYFIRSPAFATQFASVTEDDVFAAMKSFCGFRKSGPLGETEVILQDINGVRHIFQVESFSNSYHVLTLGSYIRQKHIQVGVATNRAAAHSDAYTFQRGIECPRSDAIATAC